MNLNFEGFTFPELYTNLEEYNIDPNWLGGSEEGGVQRIEDDLFFIILPDGRTVYFNSQGVIQNPLDL